ncbi:hypothetical protein ASE04_28240 [Rhizobium sp. Root708]|nr:hypothetical protein ASE04_28240 [Rhizobium sp. Root708]
MSFEPRSRSGGQISDTRYEPRQERGGTWMVADSFTDLPAASNGRDLVMLRKGDAKEMAAELNRCETEGSESPLL